jgi:hypothetical protein
MPEESRQFSGHLGIFLDRPIHQLPKGGLADARNCRVREGRVERRAMGWSPFFDIVLDGPPLLIDEFVLRTGVRLSIFGTARDLYLMDSTNGALDYLAPRYVTGSVSVVNGNTTVTGVGTAFLANVKAGDQLIVGAANVTDPSALPGWVEILSVTDDTHLELAEPYPFITAPGQLYTIRKCFTGTRLDIWSTAVFYDADPGGVDLWFATNGVDDVVTWDGVATQVTPQPALGFKCSSLHVFAGMMLYVDLLEAGERKSNVVRNSANGQPLNVSTLEAAELNGTDVADRLVAAEPLGDIVVHYGLTSISIAQFVGPPLFWVVRTVSRTVGALGRRSIVDRGERHAFMARDGGYTFDGVQVQPHGLHVLSKLVHTLDLNRLAQAIAFWNMEDAEVYWLLPSSSDGESSTAYPQRAYTEHYQEVVRDHIPFMSRDLPATAIGSFTRTEALRFDEVIGEFIAQDYEWVDRFFSAQFPTKLIGLADGSIMELGADDAQDGEPINAYARGGRLPVVDGVRRGLVREIEAHVVPTEGATHALDIRFYGAETPEGPRELLETVQADLGGVGQRWYRPRCQARYLDLEIGTDGANEGFSVSGLRMLTRHTGRR